MAYDLLLLDADMTLLDFDRAEHESLRRALANQGLPADKSITEAYSRINWALWSAYNRGEITQSDILERRFVQLFDQMGLSGDPVRCGADYFLALRDCGHTLPGALDFCRKLYAAGKTLLIATNGVAVTQWGRLRRSGLATFITRMFISGELGVQKPRREFFDRIFSTLGEPDRSRCVIMGDSLNSDIQGGLNAGIDTIWFNPNRWPGSPDICPKYEVHSYAEALEYLLED